MTAKYPKFSHRHKGVLLWRISNPCSTLTECAKATGYSRSWLSRIVNSPEFRAEYNKRLNAELISAVKRRLNVSASRIKEFT